jgi:DNA-binding SARP family transcriptional activator
MAIAADHTVTAASPDELDQSLQGTTLFDLGPREATELIDQVLAIHNNGSGDDDAEASNDPALQDPTSDQMHEDWPSVTEPDTARSPVPIEVRLLGPYRVTAHGQEVTKGLRSAAKELLAWFLLRPEGATSEAAVDAIWPDTDPELVSKRFWRALGDLRSRLRRSDPSDRLDVLIRSGDYYHPETDEISCDLWEFEQHLKNASRSRDDSEARAELRFAADLYAGDFAEGTDYVWVEPVREDLHRRALDAHVRLAELEESGGNADGAADVLLQAVQLDPFAEEVYRRLMTLQGRLGRMDSVAATWRRLQHNLAELDLDPEPATVRLHQELVHERLSTGPKAGEPFQTV